MKKIKLIVFLIMAYSTLHAQKAKVQTAWNFYKYDQLDKAKEAIEEAVNNEQSKSMEKAWYYRGLIYYSMFGHAKYSNLEKYPLEIAYESFNRSLELNPESEYKDSIKIKKANIINSQFIAGVEKYNQKNYAEAAEAFEKTLKMSPQDTLTILNAAFATERAGNADKAKKYYHQLLDMNYNDPKPYLFLSKIYKNETDTVQALEIVKKGRQKFPSNNALIIEELNFYLFGGKSKEALDPLNTAIANDEKNATLYFARGNIYDKLGDTLRSRSDYLQAIALDSVYFDAYYNIGAMYFNQGAELINKANNIPPEKQKEYAELKTKAEAKFKESRPYFEKAFQLNPQDASTISSLRQLYVRIGENKKSQEMKVVQDSLKK